MSVRDSHLIGMLSYCDWEEVTIVIFIDCRHSSVCELHAVFIHLYGDHLIRIYQ